MVSFKIVSVNETGEDEIRQLQAGADVTAYQAGGGCRLVFRSDSVANQVAAAIGAERIFTNSRLMNGFRCIITKRGTTLENIEELLK